MATKKIPDVPCWFRRWVSEVEAIARLNVTRPEWDRFIKPKATLYVGGYDMDQLNRIMEKAVVIGAR